MTPSFLIISLLMISLLCTFTLCLEFPLKRLPFNHTIEEDTEFSEKTFAPMTLEICLGTPVQCFNVAYDTGSYVLWLPDQDWTQYYEKVFISEASSSYVYEGTDIFFQTSDNSILGNEAWELIHFTNIDKHIEYYFNFVIANTFLRNSIHAEGNWGWARNYSHSIKAISGRDDTDNISRFSFLDLLDIMSLIKSKTFYHKYNSETEGILVFGEEVKLEQHEHLFKCQSTTNPEFQTLLNDFWNCKITRILLQDSVISWTKNEQDEYAMFATNEKFIFAPYFFGIKLMERYKKYAPDNCFISSDNKDYQMECSDFDFMKTPPLTFYFGEFELVIKPERLFIKEEDDVIWFAIKASNHNKFWIFGDPAIANLKGMVFDQKSNYVGFITVEQIPKGSILIKLSIGMICILGVMLVYYNIGVWWRYRQRVKLDKIRRKLRKEGGRNEMEERML